MFLSMFYLTLSTVLFEPPPPLSHVIDLCLKNVLQIHITYFTQYRPVSKQIKSILHLYVYIHPTLGVSIIILTKETRVY